MNTNCLLTTVGVVTFLCGTALAGDGDGRASTDLWTALPQKSADLFTGSLGFVSNELTSIFKTSDEPAPAAAQKVPFKPDVNYEPAASAGYKLTEQLSITPVLGYSRIHNNNVYSSENGRQQDNINRAAAGFTSKYLLDDRAAHQVSLGYTSVLEYFDRFSREDHIDHTLGLNGIFRFSALRISGGTRWSRTRLRDSINLPEPDNTSENMESRILAEVPMGRAFLESELNNENINNINRINTLFDRNDLWAFGRYGWRLSPQSSLFYEYGHLSIDYPNFVERDGDADQHGVGVRSYLSQNAYLKGRVAYQERIYDKDTSPDFFGITADMTLYVKLADQHGITVKASSGPSETIYLGQNFATAHSVSYSYRRPFLIDKLFLTNNGWVGYNEFSRTTTTSGDDETRRDWVWGEAIGFEYPLLKIPATLYVRYNYAAMESNTQSLDITTEQITYGIKGKF